MPSNAEAAELFRSIADLLDVMGERFKPEAYRRAARSIDSLTEDLATVAARGELRSVPGVGGAIEEKVREYLSTGRIHYLDRLQKEVPPGVAELLRIPGLGPKTARRFWVDLGLEGPTEVLAAIDAGRLTGVKGFGEKKIAQIRNAVEAARGTGAATRLPIETAFPIAHRIVRALREGADADRVEVAGSFRRGRETVGDLDVLVTSRDPSRAFEVFSALPEVREVRLRGSTKETVVLTNGLQVDLRVVEPESFGAALQYFTGSKDHNVLVRTLAKEAGLRVNEYGVYRGEERIAGATEEDVYAALGLAWIPPELREARGEMEAARTGPLPPLVDEPSLRGDLHVHLDSGADAGTVERLLTEARRRRYAYLGVVAAGVDAGGQPIRVAESALERLVTVSTAKLRVYRWTEVDPAEDAAALLPSGPDGFVLRPSARHRAPPVEARPPGIVILVAHLGVSDPSATPVAREWLHYAARRGAAVEVGPGPERLDSTWARSAREQGVRLVLPTGLLAIQDDPTRPVALAWARRAGAIPNDVVNAGPFRAS
ncbi:MAG TPA: helix-hairpin-helix domain-containing protein [Thermoplasmata archaeon]|nr:helix-hairpin-helix domain-containing protein [Thermoplasmata archaeon]